MTNKELIATIRNKVEGQFYVFLNLLNASQEYGYHKALEFVLSFLSDLEKSLPTQEESGSSEISKDIEEAANHYASVTDPEARGIDFTREVFIAGAECDREQMLKGAVEGEVYKFGEVAYVKECNNAELTKYLSQFNNGDKVKIIVINETDIR